MGDPIPTERKCVSLDAGRDTQPAEAASIEAVPRRRKRPRIPRGYSILKRAFDILFSLLAMALLWPVFLGVALLIEREDGGPVFYRAMRVGRYGKTIMVYKFRSMKVDADRLESVLTPAELEDYYQEFKLSFDPRVTKIGRSLRKSSLDELPQLLNVLRGDMSLVGPRPIVQEELERKYDCIQAKKLLSVRPGLTGMWQTSGRSTCTYQSGRRQAMELWYVENCCIGLDLKILVRTVRTVIDKIGAI